MSTAEELKDLFSRFLSNECSEEETEWLMKTFNAGNNMRLLESLILRQLDALGDTEFHPAEVEKVYANLSDYVQASGRQKRAGNHNVYKLLKTMAVAASVLLALGVGGYWWLNNKKAKDPLAQKEEKVSPVKDFEPGGEKAILTLADGAHIVLDSAQNGTLAQQGNAHVLKLDNGHLAYALSNEKTAEVLYNTITTPKGGQYQVALSDGTKVWLNAASSLRFPTAFTGNERKVEITGEAYFEVKPISSTGNSGRMPFIVKINTPSGDGGQIEVLGTHFNVNAYNDETDIKTTLLEGKVRISSSSKLHFQTDILPGQQAEIQMDGSIKIADNVDTERVMAWKNGLFDFNSADIKTIMRQISRWYDVEVGYEGQLPVREFSGKISRNTNASSVFKILEQSDIHFRIENKKIVVTH